MHAFLEFLYCCSAAVAVPTPRAWFDDMNAMCVLVMKRKLNYDEDPLVVVSLYHAAVEIRSMGTDLRHILGGVSSSVWGPLAWGILHELARARPDQVEPLLRYWVRVLPCPECRAHLAEHMHVTQFGFVSGEQAYQYTRTLHNAVNMQLGKKMFIE